MLRNYEAGMTKTRIEVGLNAAVVAVTDGVPSVLMTATAEADALPAGPFDPLAHRTMERSVRASVTDQTGLSIGYVEQLYTFGDRGRHARPDDQGPHAMSVGYLALTRLPEHQAGSPAVRFRPWYSFFPWEDARGGRPPAIDAVILPKLSTWSGDVTSRSERVRHLFGVGSAFDEEKVLERYELLYEAGLVEEAARDGRAERPETALGVSMRFDHRRILATAMGRLRAKMKYRPVVFELMPEAFTLTDLQHTVEAIAGQHLHKQNFRRLVETARLVEPTGEIDASTGGRPAALFRFRREVTRERPAPGLRFAGRG
jgi:hypothetical protein